MSTVSTVSTVIARCYLHLRWYFLFLRLVVEVVEVVVVVKGVDVVDVVEVVVVEDSLRWEASWLLEAVVVVEVGC